MQTRAGMSVNSYWSLCIVRFCIGFGGAAFVVTQSRGRADFFPAGRGDTAGAARIVAGCGAAGSADAAGAEDGSRRPYATPPIVQGGGAREGRGDTAGAARIVAGRGGAAVGRADRPGRDAATPVRARPR